MSVPRAKAAAQYKKQDGEIAITGDGKAIVWTSNTPGAAPVTLTAEHLTNLQQTPATSPKAVLKLLLQAPGTSAPEAFTFTFTAPSSAREELNAFIEPLKKLMEAQRSSAASSMVSPSPVPTIVAPAQSASMAMAQAVSSNGSAQDGSVPHLTDEQLLSDFASQKAVLDANPALRERMTQANKDKPANMTSTQLMRQFWVSRIHLLRAHAAERAQKRGEYHVLTDINKVRRPDGEMVYNFTGSKIRMIWQQYPYMLKIHQELFKNKIYKSENEFWAEWMTSRLYKKMKGEKITEQDWEHPQFDRFLDLVDSTSRPKHFNVGHVPRFIDMTGNEQNHSQKQGNAPDFTMKPAFNGRNELLNTLNNMSERLLMNVNPTDVEAHGPVGMDEETYNQLKLRDLQRNDKDNRVVLNVVDQRHIGATNGTNVAREVSSSDIEKAVQHVQAGIAVQPTLPIDIDDDSDDESLAVDATSNMMKSIKLRASHSASDELASSDLSAQVKDEAVMAHSTTLDFLHYFWGAFYSGDPTRAEDVRFLSETLQTSKERFETIAEIAEKERQAQMDRLQALQKDMQPSKRRKLERSLPGGRQAVLSMLGSTQEAVDFAESEYKRTLVQQMQQNPIAISTS